MSAGTEQGRRIGQERRLPAATEQIRTCPSGFPLLLWVSSLQALKVSRRFGHTKLDMYRNIGGTFQTAFAGGDKGT